MPYYATVEEANRAGVRGWNIRCNHCGSFGALWYAGRRPNWGALALCSVHAKALADELERHAVAMRVLCHINYEQPLQDT